MKRWELSRRTFLRGTGVAIGLPLLDAMMPSIARAQSGQPLRLLFWYVPCGQRMDRWTPSTTGANYAVSPILQPLADAGVKADTSVLTSLDNYAGSAQGDGPGDHARGTSTFLTCTHPYKSYEQVRLGISVDQVAANFLGDITPRRSMQLGLDGGGGSGNCDSGYSCAYSFNISWKDETTPMGKLTNVGGIFDSIVSSGGTIAPTLDKRLKLRKKVVDYVLADAHRLESRLGVRDQRKLAQYLDSMSEIEGGIRRDLESQSAEPMQCTGVQPSSGSTVEQRTRDMIELMVLALKCDVTRVITFMRANGGSNASSLGGSVGGHHDNSHHGGDAGKLDNFQKVNVFDMRLFAQFLKRLKEEEEGDANLLYNSLVFYGSEIADGNSHAHTDMPVLLAGNAGGQVTPGRHVVYPDRTPVANLFIAMLRTIGCNVSSFGDDGTAPLGQLSV